MFKELNLKDKYYLLFIIILSTIIVGYYINFNSNVGIFCSDVYIYLQNSLYYTGIQLNNNQNIYLSPLICFLTSLFFKAGFVDNTAINIVTGAFAVFGNVGMYLLLKRYFSENLSLTGTVIYSSVPLYLIWLANGTLDVPAVSMIIWTGLFTLLAVDENPKYYTPLIVFIVLGVFTRYTVLLTLPAFILYYIYQNGFKIKRRDVKYILIGILIGLAIVLITFASVTLIGGGDFGVKSQISDGFSGTQGAEIDPAYNTNVSYYLTNLPNFISTSHVKFLGNPVLESPTALSWAVIGIVIIGMLLWIYENKRKPEKKDILPVIFFIIAIISFTKTSSVITTVFVLIGLYLLGKDSNNKSVYFMLGWIFSNIIFFSYYNIKVNRYLLPIFPALIYFLILSIKTINKHLKINENILPTILVCLFIIQAFAFTSLVEPTDEYKSIENMSKYVIAKNPDYENISIGVYNMRPFSWWLDQNVIGIDSSNRTAVDKSNVTYYISNHKLPGLDNYSEIENIGKLYLYKRSV